MVAFFLVPFPVFSVAGESADLLIFAALISYALLKYRDSKKYSFDEKGVYGRGGLLFAWTRVKKIGLKFGKTGGSVKIVGQPTWQEALTGSLMQPVTVIGYMAPLVFNLDDGRVVTIASNLDRLSGNRVVEQIDELAKAANPRIEFE